MAELPDGMLALPECPITFEAFEEKGRNQPLFLPSCGHTFSREGVHSLLKKAREESGLSGKKAKGRAVRVKCPQCSMMQMSAVIDDFLPNWSLISQVQTLKQRIEAEAAEAKAQAAEDQDGSVAEDQDGSAAEEQSSSEKENTHSQQQGSASHESQQSAYATARHEALETTLEQLDIADPFQTEPDDDDEAQQVIREVEYQAKLAGMLESSSVANEPCEIPQWQTPYEPATSLTASSIPTVITEDRSLLLSPSQLASNRQALSGEMYQLVLNAVRPYLAGLDLFAVSQALSDMAIGNAESTNELLDAMARRIPVLHMIGRNWAYISDTGYVENVEDVVKRARRSHNQQEKVENERFRKAALRHPALKNRVIRCRQDEIVTVRVAARLADRAYAGVMGCGGYRLEDSPMEDVPPNENYLQVGKRLAKLEDALDSALHYMRTSDTSDDLLAPDLFFRAAAQAFAECLPPMPESQLRAARECVLCNMMHPSIEAMLAPAYGAEAGGSLATRASKILCENAPNADSLLALCSSSSNELPGIVESAVDYIICSDPSSLQPDASTVAVDAQMRPHLTYIQTARAHEGIAFDDQSFLTAQDQALRMNEQFAAVAAAGDGGGGFQNYNGRYGASGRPSANGAAGGGGGLGNLGVRPAGRAAPPPEHTMGDNVRRRMFGDMLPGSETPQSPTKPAKKPHTPPGGPPGLDPANATPSLAHFKPRMNAPTNPLHDAQPPAMRPFNGLNNGNNPFSVLPHAYAHAPPQNRMGPAQTMGGAQPHTHAQPHAHLQQHQINTHAAPHTHANGTVNGKSNMHATHARAHTSKHTPIFVPPLIDVPPNAMYKPLDQERGTQQQLPVRPGATPCAHFEKFGWCLFGERCGHTHPGGVSVKSNLCGFPIRPNIKVCKYYMLNGKCNYGMNCYFNHPNIAPTTGPDAGQVITKSSAFENQQ